MTDTIQATIDELRQTLTDYIEATYHIGHPFLINQRKRLLAAVGGIFQVPYLESTPRYIATDRYETMIGLPESVRRAFLHLASATDGKPVIYNPPYSHQAEAVRETLANGKNLMIMTGTGSGKTESFLLPILGKLAIEAQEHPAQFQKYSAMRAIVLYPMNALVNDQLGRLRTLFGSPRVVEMFEGWASRPARFARYTSRTPYAGVRSASKDGSRLGSIEEFFVAIEKAAERHRCGQPEVVEDDARAFHLLEKLKARGKWPAKPSVSAWFGTPHQPWKDRRGTFQRAVMRPHDAELLTRYEVQQNPPDLLITNYSMLEYMMMRPIERSIFEQTRQWLRDCPSEKIMIVLDEAHLYRGAQGAEVGLLMRRLRERLGIGPERFQVICATASFSEGGRATAGHFGAQLAGVPEDTFVPVIGALALRAPAACGGDADLDALNAVNLDQFYGADPNAQAEGAEAFLRYRGQGRGDGLGQALIAALSTFAPFNLLVNETMRAALPLAELGAIIFPNADTERADAAISTLLALGSRARSSPDEASLLPCRIHSFFRGLSGLWACMDPRCGALPPEEQGGPTGKLFDQPRERCTCGATVLEYFTCRYCGTSYGRAYTNDAEHPHLLWADPGHALRTDGAIAEALEPLDLLLEEPSAPALGCPANYDLITGMLNSDIQGQRQRTIYLRPQGTAALVARTSPERSRLKLGTFVPCGCCKKQFHYGQSSVQDHQTKGDQPFQSLLATQIRVQSPGPQPSTEFAPLRGRKVLVFSDSRQVAARLAPTLQNYSLRDAVRTLLPVGFQILQRDAHFGNEAVLDNSFIAVIVAAHRFGVRVRPELSSGEIMPHIDSVPIGQVPEGMDLVRLINTPCPTNLMRAIVNALGDKGLGLESLAIASIREPARLSARIAALPNLQGVAEDSEQKLAVARAWLRCWARGPGVWFNGMPPSWWSVEVSSHRGSFEDMDRVLVTKPARATFKNAWLPRLLADFTQRSSDGGTRLLATNLSMEIGGVWRRCLICKSIHRPIQLLTTCVDCGASGVEVFDPETDLVFAARRGFYRNPVAFALTSDNPSIMSLIAAEHTAQLNAAQPDDAFSQAENHEIRFQDINVAWRDTDQREPAIDVLSSTTTMEVGIDIGELSGVALRNMPPGRANYQQRAGRAGRRGNAVATVVAFGSADSHDDHYFTSPNEMIRGSVIDPRLTLENADIARRHLRAYLLQRYHEARLPDIDPDADPNLFSVLGRVRDFRDGTGILNRDNFVSWLNDNAVELREAANRWLPNELRSRDRSRLLDEMATDVVTAVDEATGYIGRPTEDSVEPTSRPDEGNEAAEEEVSEVDVDDTASDTGGDEDFIDPAADKLLDRLLYWGVLPRYAFPTDVAPFYVFNRALSTSYRPKMEFAPSQGLNIALSQYAPNKQIWIKGKQYTSKAIFSPYKRERRAAWGKRRLYFECSHCSHAKTEGYVEARRKVVITCEACNTPGSFGPAKPWFRPPGFAHPFDRDPVTTPDEPNETAYATRAKLIMQTPAPDTGWSAVGARVRGFPTRERLLVSNSGPDGDGYDYCVACGRIEAVSDPDRELNLYQPHSRPYPSDETGPCPGRVTSKIVLGTDFITDIALFSLPLDHPFRVRPGNEESSTALRTVCEAISAAACQLLEIEPGEILAEYRPSLTQSGAAGLEAEVFIYDTLAGGAGFSPQLVERGTELFNEALRILGSCPAQVPCDSSCYRCLRSFRNRLDHRLLDRHLGEQLLGHALGGGYPAYPTARVKASLDLLFEDLRRQFSGSHEFERNAHRASSAGVVTVPILLRHRLTARETWATLSSPIAPGIAVQSELRSLDLASFPVVCVDDLLVRRNLPRAVQIVMASSA